MKNNNRLNIKESAVTKVSSQRKMFLIVGCCSIALLACLIFFYPRQNTIKLTNLPVTPTVSVAQISPSILPTDIVIPPQSRGEKKVLFEDSSRMNISFSYLDDVELRVSSPDVSSEIGYYSEKDPKVKEATSFLKTRVSLRKPLPGVGLGLSLSSEERDRYCNEDVYYIHVDQYDTPQDIGLFDFISMLYSTYAGGGREEPFANFERNLSKTNKYGYEGYINKGSVGESEHEIIFLKIKDKVYTFNLGGGCDTGALIPKKSKIILDELIESIKVVSNE